MPISDADREVGLAEQIRLAIERFHDGLPQGQGDTGDGGVAGKAMCQLFYDRSDEIIEALQSQRDLEAAARDMQERAAKVAEGKAAEYVAKAIRELKP